MWGSLTVGLNSLRQTKNSHPILPLAWAHVDWDNWTCTFSPQEIPFVMISEGIVEQVSLSLVSFPEQIIIHVFWHLFCAEYSQLICKDGWLNKAVLICHICCVLSFQDLSPHSSIHPSFKRALPVFFPISLVTTSFTHLGDLRSLLFYCIWDWYAWTTRHSSLVLQIQYCHK